MKDAKVLTKADAAIKRCGNASQHLLNNGGKAWKYLLTPHDEVKEHNVLSNYFQRYEKSND